MRRVYQKPKLTIQKIKFNFLNKSFGVNGRSILNGPLLASPYYYSGPPGPQPYPGPHS